MLQHAAQLRGVIMQTGPVRSAAMSRLSSRMPMRRLIDDLALTALLDTIAKGTAGRNMNITSNLWSLLQGV